MALNRDLFSGAPGKTQKLLRSRYAATPNTKEITSHDVYCDASDELVTCSLDGLMWIYKNGDNYQVFLHEWNPALGVLNENVATCVTDPSTGDAPAIRGIDWVLTRDFILQGHESENTIKFSQLLSQTIELTGASGVSDLALSDLMYYYSFIREWDTARITVDGRPCGPGIDPFTFEGYGAGFFNSIGYYPMASGLSLYGGFDERPIDDCYSLLPQIGDWIMIEDFLVRAPSDPFSQYSNTKQFNNMLLEARPLIPLEFNYYPDADNRIQSFCSFGTGHSKTRRGIQVAAGYNRLFARGLMQLGRAFILPAAFDTDGAAEEYYLYIQNTWNCRSPYNHFDATTQTEEANADWLNTSIAALRDEDTGLAGVVAFKSERQDPLTGSLCRRSNGDILLPATNEIFAMSDGAHGYFDALTQTGLILSPQGASFLSWDSTNDRPMTAHNYECSTLEKWLAPNDRLDAIDLNGVLSMMDDGMLATDIKNHFFRTRFFTGGDYQKVLPIAWRTFWAPTGETSNTGEIYVSPTHVSLAKNETTGKVHVQRIQHDAFLTQKQMPWDSVYRNPFTVRVLQTGWYDFPSGRFSGSELRLLRSQLSRDYEEVIGGSEYRNNRQGGLWGCYREPCPIPMIYTESWLSVSKANTVAYWLINPETGEITRHPWGHDSGWYARKFPLLNEERTKLYAINSNGEIDYGNDTELPDWCKEWFLLSPTICDEDGNLNTDIPGVLPKCLRIPDYAHTDATVPISGSENTALINSCYTNRYCANMFKCRPVVAPREYLNGGQWRDNEIRNTNSNDFLIDFQESSSLMPITIRSYGFRRIADLFTKGPYSTGHISVDGQYMLDCQNKISEDFANIGLNVYGKDPVINWRGQRKYTKNLFVLRLGPGYATGSSYRTYGRYYMNGKEYGTFGNYPDRDLAALNWGSAMLWVFRIDIDP